MNLESTNGDQIPFSDPEAMFEGFSKQDILNLAYCAGDFMLAIDENKIVRDISVNVRDHAFASQWIGQKWADTVTVDSKAKIEQLLNGDHQSSNNWRQVNHSHDGDDIPVNYKVIKPENSHWHIAIGRDLRSISVLQQRLLKTQQSMERDYLHLRQTETRYRLLFDNISYPVLIADADGHVIQQANRACHALMGVAPGALDGKAFSSLVDIEYRDALLSYIASVAVNSAISPLSVRLAGRSGLVKLAASTFRQSGKQYWLVNIDARKTVGQIRARRCRKDARRLCPDRRKAINYRRQPRFCRIGTGRFGRTAFGCFA
jgi:transcriptional regulator PpsR